MPLRQLLDDWDDADKAAERIGDAVNLSLGIIIAIIVGSILFLIVSVLICIYCVCRKNRGASGRVVRGQPAPAAVATYQFQAAPSAQMYPQGQCPPPGQHPGGPYYGAAPYPPAPGPAQGYPPMTGGGYGQPAPGVNAPPPYQSLGYPEKASAPPPE